MFEVYIEFEAVNQDVLQVEGTVIPSPTIAIPFVVFCIDCVVVKIILLMTFIDVPVVREVTIVVAVTASAIAAPTVTCLTKPAPLLILALETTS